LSDGFVAVIPHPIQLRSGNPTRTGLWAQVLGDRPNGGAARLAEKAFFVLLMATSGTTNQIWVVIVACIPRSRLQLPSCGATLSTFAGQLDLLRLVRLLFG